MTQNFIIGIAGGSGSGKTFFAEALCKKLGEENALVLYQDSYYIDQSDKFDHDGGAVNFDHPDSLDFKLLASHLVQLKHGQNIQIPIYDFETHKRLAKTINQPAKKIIIIDGILILGQPDVRKHFDESVFVHTPEEIRFQRRLNRDVQERGRTPEGVKAQFSSQVKPMHDQFVEPSKQFAKIISSGTDMNIFNQILEELSQNLTRD
ncbi:MAG: uridine kinase [Halobacteriovoraceae bacterium]|jgi:uridine kinase|nr:uridine kinase [Halobacteriovoraceae bacterium]